jgi:hypothetical protein
MVVRDVDPEEDAKNKHAGGGTRFLVDLALSRLGPLQLDGMIRTAQRTFDIVVRTQSELPDAVRGELSRLFAGTNAAMNLAGTMVFQVVKQFPDPAARPTSAARSGLWA